MKQTQLDETQFFVAFLSRRVQKHKNIILTSSRRLGTENLFCFNRIIVVSLAQLKFVSNCNSLYCKDVSCWLITINSRLAKRPHG